MVGPPDSGDVDGGSDGSQMTSRIGKSFVQLETSSAVLIEDGWIIVFGAKVVVGGGEEKGSFSGLPLPLLAEAGAESGGGGGRALGRKAWARRRTV